MLAINHTIFTDIYLMFETKLIGHFTFWTFTKAHFFVVCVLWICKWIGNYHEKKEQIETKNDDDDYAYTSKKTTKQLSIEAHQVSFD